MITSTVRIRGICHLRTFLTHYTKKQKLRVLVIQFFYRLGCTQEKFKRNLEYRKQKADIVRRMFISY